MRVGAHQPHLQTSHSPEDWWPFIVCHFNWRTQNLSATTSTPGTAPEYQRRLAGQCGTLVRLVAVRCCKLDAPKCLGRLKEMNAPTKRSTLCACNFGSWTRGFAPRNDREKGANLTTMFGFDVCQVGARGSPGGRRTIPAVQLNTCESTRRRLSRAVEKNISALKLVCAKMF